MTRTEKRLVDACVKAEGGTPEAKSLYSKVWSVIVKIVERELCKGSRVSVPNLGTFGIQLGPGSSEGVPFFTPKPDLLAQFRMDYEGPRPMPGEKLGPMAELKPGSIARSTGEKVELNMRVGSLTLLPAGHLLFCPKPIRLSAAPPKDGSKHMPDEKAQVPEFCPVPPPLPIRQALTEKFREGDELKVREMEALLSRRAKRDVGLAKNSPQTARAVLPENRILSERKAEALRQAKSDSLDMVEQLLQREQESVEKERAKARSRREAQTALARQYKDSIAKKEQE